MRHARPRRVIITTPNPEYNAKWPSLPAGRFRHRDHRFEWTRAEFADVGANGVRTGRLRVAFQGVGPEDEMRLPDADGDFRPDPKRLVTNERE